MNGLSGSCSIFGVFVDDVVELGCRLSHCAVFLCLRLGAFEAYAAGWGRLILGNLSHAAHGSEQRAFDGAWSTACTSWLLTTSTAVGSSSSESSEVFGDVGDEEGDDGKESSCDNGVAESAGRRSCAAHRPSRPAPPSSGLWWARLSANDENAHGSLVDGIRSSLISRTVLSESDQPRVQGLEYINTGDRGGGEAADGEGEGESAKSKNVRLDVTRRRRMQGGRHLVARGWRRAAASKAMLADLLVRVQPTLLNTDVQGLNQHRRMRLGRSSRGQHHGGIPRPLGRVAQQKSSRQRCAGDAWMTGLSSWRPATRAMSSRVPWLRRGTRSRSAPSPC